VKILLSVLHVFIGICLMGAVLLQQRKTGGFSGIFGGGTQADAGGGQWQRFTALSKLSVLLMAIFMLSSLLLVFVLR